MLKNNKTPVIYATAIYWSLSSRKPNHVEIEHFPTREQAIDYALDRVDFYNEDRADELREELREEGSCDTGDCSVAFLDSSKWDLPSDYEQGDDLEFIEEPSNLYKHRTGQVSLVVKED